MSRTLECYRSIAKRNEQLSKKDTIAMVEAVQANSPNAAKAMDRLAKGYVKLVLSTAMKFKTSGVDLDDLIQDAQFAFLRAVNTFDPAKGSFAGYVSFVMYAALINQYNKSRSIQEIKNMKVQEAKIHQGQYVNQQKEEAWKQRRRDLIRSNIKYLTPMERAATLLSLGYNDGIPWRFTEIVSVFSSSAVSKTDPISSAGSVGRLVKRGLAKLRRRGDG